MNEQYAFTSQAGGIALKGSVPSQVLFETARGSTPIPIETYVFSKGIIYIGDTIDDEMSKGFIMALQIAKEDKKNIRIFINSPGGSVSAGLAMYDAMNAYPYDIDIYCTGLAASMAAVLLAGGRKGHRYIMPHSKVMIHEPLISGGLGGSATSIQRTADSIIDTKKTLNGMLSQFTGKPIEEIDKNTAFDNYFTAEQAIGFGLCDRIATGFETV